MSKPAEVWWRRVPVAVNFIEQCIADAKEFNPSYLNSRSLPWADQFLRITEKAIRDQSQLFKVYTIDGSRFDPSRHYTILDPMVEAVGSFGDYDGTIASVGNVLNSGMIFFLVRARDREQLDALKMIVFDAREYGVNLRLIVLSDEFAEDDPVMKSFEYHSFDINFFAWNLLLDKNSTDMLNYKAIMATLLSDHDAEKAAACCKEIDNCMYSPEQVCTWMNRDQIIALMRKAKIRFLMPELETARMNFCYRVKDRFGDGVLPHTDYVYGERVLLSLEELEFRHYKYLAKDRRKLALSQDEKDMLQILYDGRNALAHIGSNDDLLTVEYIQKIKRICDELE